MHLDKLQYFCEALALTATADAPYCIDLKAAGQLGNGRPLQVIIHVDVAADGTTTDETYSFAVTTDDNAALSSDTTINSKTLTYAQLAINTLHAIDIPENVATERYLGLVATLGGTSPSVTITAWLAEKGTTPNVKTYPNNYDV